MTAALLHCKQTTISSQAEGFATELNVSELVSPGQLLVSLPENSPADIILAAGEYTELTPEKNGIVAICHGFPRIVRENTDSGEKILVSLVPVIRITVDHMEARLSLDPPLPGKMPPDIAAIDAALQHHGIVYGVDPQLVTTSLAELVQTGLPVTDRIIARGREPLAGEDAWLRLEIEMGPVPGTILGNGSIDFRERRMFVSVKKGELLATKIPRTLGIHGTNLLGEILPAKEGKDLTVKVSDEARYSETDGTVRANAPGVVSLVNNNSLRVSSKQQITSDVDYHTGNIRSQCNVEISGSVHPGFMVSTRGDLLIGGDIQSATVNCRGNVAIKGGVVGEESQIHAQGDVEINYIERGLLISGGSILLHGSAYYSTIQAAGDVSGSDKVTIVGGNLCIGGSLSVGRIGSSYAEPAEIAVGIDPLRYRHYLELLKEHDQLVSELQNHAIRHGQDAIHDDSVTGLNEDIAAIERQLRKLNLVTGSPEESLGDTRYFYSPAEIRVSGLFPAETSIRIGNETTTLKRDLNHSKACMDPKTGSILFLPL
jgi:uncharacterized protein